MIDLTTLDPATLQERIDGRKWAEEVLGDLPTDKQDPFRQGFMDRMQRCFQVTEFDPGAMTDAQSQAFGRRVLNVGCHRDKTYDECPLDYIEWLAEQNAELTRYLRSRRIREEREHDD